uniref:Uncharacterized protein n=1 Tax=Anguilla anguilla TaxID=7936 RepID=A0A0E9R9B3_ANGAN
MACTGRGSCCLKPQSKSVCPLGEL